MREAFETELVRFRQELADLAHHTQTTMNRATTALLDNSVDDANGVIAADDDVSELHHDIDQRRWACSPGSNRWRATCARSWPACG